MTGILLLLLCAQPALGSPNAVSYEQYVTLIHDQDGKGGCIGYSYTHVLEILKEMEAPYTPDPSYAFLNYVFVSATMGSSYGVTDPRVPHDPNMGGFPILSTYGLCPETSYQTDFSGYGDTYPEMLNRPPSQTAFDEAQAYRVLSVESTANPSITNAEDWLATKGPLICSGLFEGHAVALIGYNRGTSEFTIVDSANWLGIDHAGVKKVPYVVFESRQPNMTIEALTNRPTPLVHPYAARIKIKHNYRRSMLTVLLGVPGHTPVTVWDQNNLNNWTDLGQDLTIDVPLPAYAAEHWPPSDQNQWYVQVTNHGAANAELQEVTLVRRYQPSPISNEIACDVYAQLGMPRTIPLETASTIYFPNKITVTSPNGGEHWTGGEWNTVTWNQTGLSGTYVKIDLLKGNSVVRTIEPVKLAQYGTCDWQVPTDLEPGSDYYVRIESLVDPLISDQSDGPLTVISLVADFTATPVTGNQLMTVHFADTSTGHPTSWSWNFGDGQTSQAQSPSHTYSAAGTFSVSLTVTYADDESRSVTKTNLITVLPYMWPDFSASSRTGYEPFTAYFTDTTIGTPTAWNWSFGDGEHSTVKNPSHTYSSPGLYWVWLTVSNPVDGAKTVSKADYIRVLPLWNGLSRTEAEDYSTGGEGVAYHDTTAGNMGGAYRQDDVDIWPLGTKGYVVGRTAEGEWTQYSVWSGAAENYNYPLSLRVASWAAGQTITVTVAGMTGSIDIAVPNTGSGDTYAYANATLRLKPGLNTVRFTYHGSAMNFDFFTLDPSGLPPSPTPTPTPWPVLTIPGGTGLPTWITVAGKFDDVNGNNRKDFADVVLYFNQMAWIAVYEPVEGFDYNGNGRIDFADVVWLFNNL